MKLRKSFHLYLALSLAPAFGAAASAHADPAMTYSSTQQSQVVRAAIDALDHDDLAGFRKLLTDNALETHGSPEAMEALRAQYRRQTAQVTGIETQSDRIGMWQGDKYVLLSSRVYAVNVLGHRGAGADVLDPIWNVSVKCYTFSLTDGLGGPAADCKISELALSVHAQDSGAPATPPAVRDLAGKPVLGDAVNGAGREAAPLAGSTQLR